MKMNVGVVYSVDSGVNMLMSGLVGKVIVKLCKLKEAVFNQPWSIICSFLVTSHLMPYYGVLPQTK